MSEAYPDYDELMAAADERRAAMLDSRRSHAAWRLASSLTVLEALMAGRPVRLDLLDEPYRSRLPFWGGFLDDAAALDVAILDEQLRVEAEAPAPPPPPRPPRSAPAPSLRDLDVTPIDGRRRG